MLSCLAILFSIYIRPARATVKEKEMDTMESVEVKKLYQGTVGSERIVITSTPSGQGGYEIVPDAMFFRLCDLVGVSYELAPIAIIGGTFEELLDAFELADDHRDLATTPVEA